MFGSSTVKRSWDQYLVKFQRIVEENSVHMDDRAGILFQKLEGEAEDAVSDLSAADQRDLDKLVNCLNKTFEKYQDSEDARILLENHRQKVGETIAAYGKALNDLARKAYPLDRDERKRAIHRRLEFGLGDHPMRMRYVDNAAKFPTWTIEDHLSDLKHMDSRRVMGGAAPDGTSLLALQEREQSAISGQDASSQLDPRNQAAINAVNTPGQQSNRGGFAGGRGGRGKNNRGRNNRGRGQGGGSANASGENRQGAGGYANNNYNQGGQASGYDQKNEQSGRKPQYNPGGYRGAPRNYASGGRGRQPKPDDVCFKCGRKGHWAHSHGQTFLVQMCPCPPEEFVGQEDDESTMQPGN